MQLSIASVQLNRMPHVGGRLITVEGLRYVIISLLLPTLAWRIVLVLVSGSFFSGFIIL